MASWPYSCPTLMISPSMDFELLEKARFARTELAGAKSAGPRLLDPEIRIGIEYAVDDCSRLAAVRRPPVDRYKPLLAGYLDRAGEVGDARASGSTPSAVQPGERAFEDRPAAQISYFRRNEGIEQPEPDVVGISVKDFRLARERCASAPGSGKAA